MQSRLQLRAGSPRRGLLRRGVAAVATAAVVSAAVISGASAVQSKVPAAPNLALPDQCELDLAVSLDMSLSITDEQLRRMKQEVGDLAHALTDYPIQLAIHDFASNAPAHPSNGFLPLTGLADGGAETVADHVDGLLRAPRNKYYTNWDQAMVAVGSSGEDYHGLIFVTDGDPTRHGSPAQGSGSGTSVADITEAVRSANALKAQGTRVIGMGVADTIRGTDLDRFREHMSQISGPVQGADYHVADFATLKETIVDIVDASCAGVSPSRTPRSPASTTPWTTTSPRPTSAA